MPPVKKKPDAVPIKKVQSFVKKELAGLTADAKRLGDFLSSVQGGPERISIKVCDCCIKVE